MIKTCGHLPPLYAQHPPHQAPPSSCVSIVHTCPARPHALPPCRNRHLPPTARGCTGPYACGLCPSMSYHRMARTIESNIIVSCFRDLLHNKHGINIGIGDLPMVYEISRMGMFIHVCAIFKQSKTMKSRHELFIVWSAISSMQKPPFAFLCTRLHWSIRVRFCLSMSRLRMPS